MILNAHCNKKKKKKKKKKKNKKKRKDNNDNNKPTHTRTSIIRRLCLTIQLRKLYYILRATNTTFANVFHITTNQ